MNKTMKLTKLTVANLERVKGGEDFCPCGPGLGIRVENRDSLVSKVVCMTPGC